MSSFTYINLAKQSRVLLSKNQKTNYFYFCSVGFENIDPCVLGPRWASCGLGMYRRSLHQWCPTTDPGTTRAPLNFKLEVISSKSGTFNSILIVGALQTLKGWERRVGMHNLYTMLTVNDLNNCGLLYHVTSSKVIDGHTIKTKP